MASNSRGAAPWNEKIDCFSSPTAKIVRLTVRAPAPAKNSAGQKSDDFPLLRAGILRLVDQHVIDALIELVMHPGRAILAQQCACLVDQIVVVEKPALVLRPLVAGDHRIGDGEERGRAVAAGDRLATLS